jgi:calcium-translocating P-type ATPase
VNRITDLPPENVAATLRSRPSGLSSLEAQQRLAEYGLNRVEAVKGVPLVLRLGREFVHLFALILWIAAGLAFVAALNDPGHGMAEVGWAVIAVIVVSAIFSFWQEYRAERMLAALQGLLPQQGKALRDGGLVQLSVQDLVPGDVILLEQGDNVPADCRLIESFSVRVNNATLTGESLPQPRDAGPSTATDLVRSRNVVLAGTSVVAGQAKAIVFATGMQTEFGKISHLAQTAGDVASPLRREISHLGRVIATLAVSIGVLFFAIASSIGIPFWQRLIFAIGIIVAMVPEGLLPTLTLALVLATQRMAKRQVLMRHLPSVETLGSTTVICTDKTGTLTQNRMTVKQFLVGGALYSPGTDADEPNLVQRYEPFFLGTLLCNDLKESPRRGKAAWIGDPMEVALAEMARLYLPAFAAPRRLDEMPFDTDRMRLSVVFDIANQPTLYCKGAPEFVLPLCNRMLVNEGTAQFEGESRRSVFEAHERMAKRGLRVLAFAYGELVPGAGPASLEQDLVFTGLAGLEDPPRAEVPDAIRRCRDAGIKVIMVTGDHPQTAASVARQIGLVLSSEPVVISGEHLRNLSDTQLQLALDAHEVIFARVGADQKMRIVNALKKKQHVVAVTGDGVNDAPALRSAHVGIAMGISGSDVAKEAADMVLLDDNFASIVNAIEEGRAVFENIRKFLTYILTHNVAQLVPYLAFVLFRIPLPITPIQILAVDMGTDSLTALGLGVERPEPRLMQRPPRPPRERLLNWSLGLRAYVFLGLIEATACIAAFFFALWMGGWRYGQPLAPADPLYLQATTATLSAIIVMQIVNVFLCRSATRSMVSTGLFGNPFIVWGVVLELILILAIDYTSFGNAIFGTAPIAVEVWLFILPFAAAMVVLEEARKRFVRRLMRGETPYAELPR